MSAEDQAGATDTSEETEPQVAAEQQAQPESEVTSYGEALLKLASDEGHDIGVDRPKAEDEPEEPKGSEAEPEAPEEEKPEEEEKAEEEKPEEWPVSAKQRVAEETAKRKRANERAEKAEATVSELQAQLVKAVSVPPTEENPFADIQNINDLDRLERSYEKAIDLADENPGEEGAVDVLVGRDKDGNDIRRDFTQEELLSMRRKADKATRKQIPEHRKYLEERTVADAQAIAMYPELKDPESEFSQQTAFLVYRLLSGQGMKDPTLLQWVAHAVKGFRDYQKRNGAAPGAQTEQSRKILQSAKQQIAPSPTRTRSFPERGRGADLAKAEKELEAKGTSDAAEKYVAAVFARKGTSTKKLEPLAE